METDKVLILIGYIITTTYVGYQSFSPTVGFWMGFSSLVGMILTHFVTLESTK